MSSRQSVLHRFFLKIWYEKGVLNRIWVFILLPVSWFFIMLLSIRRCALSWQATRFQQGNTSKQGVKFKQTTNPKLTTKPKQATQFGVPVVVVGNISVGGVGKTPVVIALSQALADRKIKIGIISRGYGGNNTDKPLLVDETTSTHCSGDESKLLVREAQCPVIVCKNRALAADYLIEQFPDTQLIISDDGLQHYGLSRSMEIVVVDGQRGFGNGFCLPAGPLRETKERLNSVDWVVVNGGGVNGGGVNGNYINGNSIDPDLNLPINNSKVIHVELKPVEWQQVKTQRCFPLDPSPWQTTGKPIVGVAAIGNPNRFFDTLKSLNIKVEQVMFDDHHAFTIEDFHSFDGQVVLMTTKDAVKCSSFAEEQWWALGVKLQLPDKLISSILSIIYK